MPPRTRTRVTKVLKENIDIIKINKPKSDGKVAKKTRKALADKTNSLSDDNASIDVPIKASKTVSKGNAKRNADENVRPRRDRRLPPRYVENQVLKNLSNNKDSPVKQNPVTCESNVLGKLLSKNDSLSHKTLAKRSKTQAKSSIMRAPDNENKPPTKVLSKVKEKSKINKPGKNSEHIPDVQSKKANDRLSKPAENTDNLVSTHVPSKEERITLTTRPRRNCRLQSAVLKPASNEVNLNVSSPFKTPSKDLESSLVANRPKRIHRLPPRFEDHSVSPNKFIPVQPCYASTPIIQKNAKTDKTVQNTSKEKENDGKPNKGQSAEKPVTKYSQKKHTKTKIYAIANSSNSSLEKSSSPDTNNNGKKNNYRSKTTVKTKLQTKVSPKVTKITFTKRLLDKSLSFRVLEDRKQSKENVENLDVYEFTFNPNDEPAPQKKKRKRAVKKKPAKPKMVLPMIPKSNYNINISNALANLKSKVKPSQSQPVQSNIKPTNTVKSIDSIKHTEVQNTQFIAKPKDIPQSNYSVNDAPALPVNKSAKDSIHESNYASICIEDIAAEFDPIDHHDDINYSPVNLPHPHTEVAKTNENHINPVQNKDPLNLQGDLSFFDEHPVASSSMNISTRGLLASPWRVEFTNLPMKWHSNAYVKPNMTPAVESSFINSEEMGKTKHVYTNLVENNPLPEIEPPNLKQPSIISFMKEVAERNANKKKRRRSPSPTKANFIFEDINSPNEFGFKTPKKAKKNVEANISNNSNDKSDDKEISKQSSNKSVSPQNKKDKDCTYFGFDDSEIDQENVSPVKVVLNTRGLRSRPALKEFNQAAPTRAIMPITKAKMTSSEVVEHLYDQLKSAEVAPAILEKETAEEPADNNEGTNLDDLSWDEEDDEQSVHLFEDIEVVHHLKPHRKSYGKAKKVTFRQRSNSDSDTQLAVNRHSSDDDLADLTFQMPNVKQKRVVKKKKPKKQLSKKEEKEVEEWAAGFNSMCEDIDDFALLVE